MAKILIVDDDKFTRTVLETIFRQDKSFVGLAVEVVTAPDGERGLAMFEEHRPDAVVLDLLMPKLDGFGLCKGIRAHPQGDTTHLAVMSGVYRDNAIATRLSQEYDAHFFAKPYQLKDMTRFVADLLAGGKRVPPVDPQSPILETAPGLDDDMATSVSAGELAERALPAVLLDLLDAEATGRLVVRRGKVTKTIELLLGHPIAVSSSLRDETLGQLLVTSGVISDAQHRQALARASSENTRVGEALIDLGVITPEQLAIHLTGQLRHKLVTSLRWPNGVWRFEPERNVAGAQRGGTIDGLSTIVTGLRDSVDLAHPPPYVRSATNLPLFLKQRGHRLLGALDRYVADNLSELWRDGASMEELAGYGIDKLALVTAVDILLLTDGAEAEREEERSQPGVGFDSGPGLSVSQLSEHSQMARLSALAEQDERAGELYDSLFDDGSTMAPLPTGAEPLEITETDDGVPTLVDEGESGVIDVANMSAGGDTPSAAAVELQRARRMLLKEFLRIQGLDHYGVLKVTRDALEATISAAVVERRSKFSMDWYSRFDLGRDYGKLEQLHAAYDEAFETLIEPDRRAAYDQGASTAGDDTGRAPPLEAEIAFGIAEELLAAGNYAGALAKLGDAIGSAPEDATYLATLGWTHYLAAKRTATGADEARRHINEALAKNPDSAVAHAYKGVIGAELGDDDDDARFHLEQALDVEPGRADAIEALETLWRRAGEFRPLEKLYRRLIYRTAGRNSLMELMLWRKLAELYRTELNDPESARVAYQSASRMSPSDAGLQAALADLDSGAPDRFFERAEVLRSHWRRDPNAAGPGVELMRAAEQAARADACFMTASALVARGLATPEAEEMYQRYRPRFLLRAHQLLDTETLDKLRHPDDAADIGYLFELMARAVAAEMPLSLDDLEIDASSRIAEERLPDAFVRVRAYVAHMLGVPVPPVFLRSDFGRQIHVGAVDPPILLAGDDALAAPERSELGFRLGRAMTYLYPGRALGGSRPSRFLKAAVLAAWKMATPDAAIDDPTGQLARIEARLAALPPEHRNHICATVADITARHRALNLSRWSRGLARSADRVGLLLCGDLPAAIRFAADVSGSAGAADLVDFAIGSAHLALRARLGLSIDV